MKKVPVVVIFVLLLLLSAGKKANQTDGKDLYEKYCLSCHQADGNGVRGMFPPLAGNKVITGQADTLIRIVLTGLHGPIEVNGATYNQVMPAQDYLKDAEIAGILTFIRSSWGNDAPPVKEDEVAKQRQALPK
jgi:mono/diheme cytochrome c family protein